MKQMIGRTIDISSSGFGCEETSLYSPGLTYKPTTDAQQQSFPFDSGVPDEAFYERVFFGPNIRLKNMVRVVVIG